MLKKIMFYFTRTVDIAVEMIAVLGAGIAYFYFGDTQSAIFAILVALYFGRGQAARVLAREIRSEMEKE